MVTILHVLFGVDKVSLTEYFHHSFLLIVLRPQSNIINFFFLVPPTVETRYSVYFHIKKRKTAKFIPIMLEMHTSPTMDML